MDEKIWEIYSKIIDENQNSGKQLKIRNIDLNNIHNELDTATSVLEDIGEFIREEQFSKGGNPDKRKVIKYVIDRIDGLTEMCPILYSLSHDSAKENAETD